MKQIKQQQPGCGNNFDMTTPVVVSSGGVGWLWLLAHRENKIPADFFECHFHR